MKQAEACCVTCPLRSASSSDALRRSKLRQQLPKQMPSQVVTKLEHLVELSRILLDRNAVKAETRTVANVVSHAKHVAAHELHSLAEGRKYSRR